MSRNAEDIHSIKPQKMIKARSVKRELFPPVRAIMKFRLLILKQHTGLQSQSVHLRPHKAAITVFRRANYRLPAHIETGVDDYRATGLLTERLDDLPVERAHVPAHGLNSGRIIHVCNSGDLRSDHIELLYPP